MAAETTTIDYPKGLTFEQVWAALMENREQMKENDRLINLKFEKTEKLLDEVTKNVNNLSKNLGGLGNSMGDLIVTLIAARLWEKFSAFPYDLKRGYQSVYIYDENHKAITDIDILLSNTEWVMAVEVKNKVKKDDIEDHLIRMERIRKYPPAEVKGKKLLGALAGVIVSPDMRDFAYKCGFFVIELKGESAVLVPPPEGFSPHVW